MKGLCSRVPEGRKGNYTEPSPIPRPQKVAAVCKLLSCQQYLSDSDSLSFLSLFSCSPSNILFPRHQLSLCGTKRERMLASPSGPAFLKEQVVPLPEDPHSGWFLASAGERSLPAAFSSTSGHPVSFFPPPPPLPESRPPDGLSRLCLFGAMKSAWNLPIPVALGQAQAEAQPDSKNGQEKLTYYS